MSRKFDSLSDSEKLDKIQHHLEHSDNGIGFPVPAPWVNWLLGRFSTLTGRDDITIYFVVSARPFEQLTEMEKYSKLSHAVAEAQLSDDPDSATVPAPWVRWLLNQYNEKVAEAV